MSDNNQKTKILLVEDDDNLGYIVKEYLEMQPYSVDWQTDGKKGLQAFFNSEYDLCIFDVMLPIKDGLSLAEDIRRVNMTVPIIFLTAKGMPEDKIKGFKAGADDYITKPFSAEEFILRVNAVLKRTKGIISGKGRKNIFIIGKFELDYDNLTLNRQGNSQPLTRKEADLLKLLIINKNELLTREMALNIVWGSDDYFLGRSMDVFITKLRKYLKDDENISIVNVHGIGYKFRVDE